MAGIATIIRKADSNRAALARRLWAAADNAAAHGNLSAARRLKAKARDVSGRLAMADALRKAVNL